MLSKVRFYVGVGLFIFSFLIPLLGIWVAQLSLPGPVKTLVIGLLTLGGPEIIALLAVALLGKETFEWLREKLLSMLGKLAPQGSVSRTRYNIGLVLFVVSFVPSYVLSYAPSLVPEVPPVRIITCIAADLLFLCSLFVLGGDFWDKLRSLFLYNAHAQLPQSDATHS